MKDTEVLFPPPSMANSISSMVCYHNYVLVPRVPSLMLELRQQCELPLLSENPQSPESQLDPLCSQKKVSRKTIMSVLVDWLCARDGTPF